MPSSSRHFFGGLNVSVITFGLGQRLIVAIQRKNNKEKRKNDERFGRGE